MFLPSGINVLFLQSHSKFLKTRIKLLYFFCLEHNAGPIVCT